MSNLRHDRLDWNRLWATADQMEIAWRAIDEGDVETLKKCFQAYPKIYRWRRLDGHDFLDFFALSPEPSVKVLEFLLTTPLFSDDEDHKASFGGSLSALCDHGGSLRAAELLLKHGADPNHWAGFSDTPLLRAVNRNRLDLVALLLRHGADPVWEGHAQKTPLAAAEELEYHDIASHLRHAGAPLKGKPIRKKTKVTEATIEIDKATPRLEKLFSSAVSHWSRSKLGPVGSIGVSCSGVKGYVRIAINGERFEPYSPDCCDQFPVTKEIRIAEWRNAFAKKDRVRVRSGSKEKAFTELTAFRNRDKMFFDFVRDQFFKALKSGVFDALETSEKTVYGCQNYYFHHCVCWDRRYKKIATPKVWEQPASADPISIDANSADDASEPLSKSKPVLRIRKSADRISCDAEAGEWLLQNSSGIQRVPFGRATPKGRIPNEGFFIIDPDFAYCLTSDDEIIHFYDYRSWRRLASAKLPPDSTAFLEIYPYGKGSWLLVDQAFLIQVAIDAKGKLRQTQIEVPMDCISNFSLHQDSGLIAMNERLSEEIQVGRIKGSDFVVESQLPIDEAIDDINAIHDLAWHSNGFLLGVRYSMEDESDRIALVEGTELNIIADTLVGIDVLCGDLRWSPDGQRLACSINGDRLRNLVLFDGINLDVVGRLPVTDICTYEWSSDGTQLLVGGYKETTLWACHPNAKIETLAEA